MAAFRLPPICSFKVRRQSATLDLGFGPERKRASSGQIGVWVKISQRELHGWYMAKEASEILEDRLPNQTVLRRLRLDLIGERLALVAAVLAVWWLSSLSMPPYIVTRSGARLGSAPTHRRQRRPVEQLAITLWRVSVGFVVAALIGLPLGIVLGANKRAGEKKNFRTGLAGLIPSRRRSGRSSLSSGSVFPTPPRFLSCS